MSVIGYFKGFVESHPAWDAWIETQPYVPPMYLLMSHPAWDAWIETLFKKALGFHYKVASHTGVRGLKPAISVAVPVSPPVASHTGVRGLKGKTVLF